MKPFLRFLPILILLLAFGLRVYKLGDLNLNWDEGYSNWLVRQPFAQMLETTANDVHPPVYYLALRAQRVFTGDGEFVLRYPSVMFGILTVAVVYSLGRSIGGKLVGLLAMLLFALSRANIDISQLMRMHMMAGLFSAGALWAAVHLFRVRQKQRPYAVWQLIYIVCVLGALHTFYLAVVLPLATNLAFLIVWGRRKFPRRFLITWLIPQIVAALLFLPWALYAIQRMHGWSAEEPTSFG
ncbi:MAG: glycosyltransferase family 39 protein, partial [Chitinophagaceae bacterium]|nr:glycosyltransferase family 39 protein [Anaerolineae bacterium]